MSWRKLRNTSQHRMVQASMSMQHPPKTAVAEAVEVQRQRSPLAVAPVEVVEAWPPTGFQQKAKPRAVAVALVVTGGQVAEPTAGGQDKEGSVVEPTAGGQDMEGSGIVAEPSAASAGDDKEGADKEKDDKEKEKDDKEEDGSSSDSDSDAWRRRRRSSSDSDSDWDEG